MSSRFIPKEELSVVERWEFGAIGERSVRFDSGVQLPTAAEIQALQEQAIGEGYNAGLGEAKAHAARLVAMLRNVETARQQMLDKLAEQILDLALDVANQVVRTTLKLHPELIVPVVREAMQTLPGVQGEPLLVLNPADAEFVREQLAEELERDHWRVAVDPNMRPGGCRIETTGGDIDGTVGKRWSRVMEALGTNHDWVE